MINYWETVLKRFCENVNNIYLEWNCEKFSLLQLLFKVWKVMLVVSCTFLGIFMFRWEPQNPREKIYFKYFVKSPMFRVEILDDFGIRKLAYNHKIEENKQKSAIL